MSDEKKKKPRKVFPFEMTVTLRKTITLGKGPDATDYDEIPLREPDVEELSQFFKNVQKMNAIDSVRSLISAVSGVPISVIAKMGTTDFWVAQEYVTSFCTPPDEDDPEGN